MSRCYCNCCPEYIKSTQYNFFGWWRGGVKAWESTAGAIRIAGQRRRPKTDDDDDGKTTTTTTTTGGSQYNSSVTIWLQEIGWAHWTLAIPIVGAGSLVDCLQMITSVWRDEFRVPKMVKCLFVAVNINFVFRSGPQSNRAAGVVHG